MQKQKEQINTDIAIAHLKHIEKLETAIKEQGKNLKELNQRINKIEQIEELRLEFLYSKRNKQ